MACGVRHVDVSPHPAPSVFIPAKRFYAEEPAPRYERGVCRPRNRRPEKKNKRLGKIFHASPSFLHATYVCTRDSDRRVGKVERIWSDSLAAQLNAAALAEIIINKTEKFCCVKTMLIFMKLNRI